MRAILRFIIQLAVIVLGIWLLVKYTTLDDSVIAFFRANTNNSTQTGDNMASGNSDVCTTPWGIKIPDGSSIYAYWTEGNECKEELRSCNKGTLDGSYPYSSCNPSSSNGQNTDNTGANGPTISNGNGPIAQGASCTTPWGETVNDGGYIIAYESAQSCRLEKRYCENGKLNGSFTSNTCYSPTGIAQGNAVNVTTPSVTHISYGYVQGTSTTTSNGSEYQGPSRTSTNGATTVIYSWNDNKTNPVSRSANNSDYVQPTNYRNYDLTQHGCTTPWGTYIDHGSYVIAYRSATTPTGVSCAYERRTCFQGVLGGSYGFPTCGKSDSSKIYNNNGQDYYYPQNTSHRRSCTTPWGETVKDGDFVLAYKSTSTSQGYACQGEYRYCSDGRLQGSYNYRSCSMTQYKYSCTLPWGGKLPHGSSVLAYANSSHSCASELRTCNYGRLSGTYRYSSCTDNNYRYDRPYNRNRNNGCNYGNCGNNNYNHNYNNGSSCQLPWGGVIMNGASVVSYSSQNGPCYSQVRTCYNGSLNGSYQYSWCGGNNNNGCNSGNCGGNNNYYGPKSCTTPWGQVIANGARVEAYQNSYSPCYKQTRVCHDGVLDGSFQYGNCNATNNQGAEDRYGSRQNAGQHQGSIDNLDTCNSDAATSFSCATENTHSCTDYRRVSCTSFSPMNCTYESRSVSCVR